MVVMMGGKPVRLVWNPNPDIQVSDAILHIRDGNKHPAQGDTVQICVDSRGRHRSVPPDGERGTYKLSDHEVMDVSETCSPLTGERRRMYQLRRKG